MVWLSLLVAGEASGHDDDHGPLDHGGVVFGESFVPDLVSLVSLVAGTHSHCLDIPGNNATPGLAMQLYACNGTAAQKWFVYGP